MAETPGAIRTYRDLVAWQVGMELAEVVYRVTRNFDKAERYGLTSQMWRAAGLPPRRAQRCIDGRCHRR